ncbi:MAG: hypothetical protein ACLUE2_12060 [Bacteroides cellulosilyticus]
MEILRSRSILLQVINELNLHTKYKVKDGLFYNETTIPPIIASMDKASMDTLSGTLLIQVEKAGERYTVSSALDDICVTETFTGFPAFVETPAGRCTLKITARTSVFRSHKDKHLPSYRCRERLFRSAGGHYYLEENFHHQSDLQGYG